RVDFNKLQLFAENTKRGHDRDILETMRKRKAAVKSIHSRKGLHNYETMQHCQRQQRELHLCGQ
ncbi:MAG: hypothetical protein K2M70_05010, partial [Lachnospiraceae bacterium]|nr:hypothetical protein [Lachnospiraceae bacterium]